MRFQKITLVILSLLIVCCSSDINFYPENKISELSLLDSTVICKDYEFELIFFDEFNTDSLDVQKWVTYYPYGNSGSDSCEYCRTHGNEGQIYEDKNVNVIDGCLYLNTYEEKSAWYSQKRNYTSGMIHSKQNYKFKYGKFEMRAKIPEGMGFWPAFWLYGDNANEIDIFEFGCQNTIKMFTNIHTEVDCIHYSLLQTYKARTYLSDDYHVYSLIFLPNQIMFYLDDKLVRNVPKYWELSGKEILCFDCLPPGLFLENKLFPENDMNIIVNLAIGTETTPFTKSPDENTVFPNALVIDYLRVYKLVDK